MVHRSEDRLGDRAPYRALAVEALRIVERRPHEAEAVVDHLPFLTCKRPKERLISPIGGDDRFAQQRRGVARPVSLAHRAATPS